MNTSRISFCLLFFFVLQSDILAQRKTYTLSSATHGEDALLRNLKPDENEGHSPECNSGITIVRDIQCLNRSLLYFDFSFIRRRTRVVESWLTLHNNPDEKSMGGGHSFGNNTSVIVRVTQPWQADSVTWNNQPQTTNMDKVILPPNQGPHADYAVNVTKLVQQMVDNPSTNYGFMLRLDNEEKGGWMVFASGDHPDSTKHPVLEITIDEGDIGDTICTYYLLRADANNTQDAVINSSLPEVNDASSPELNALSWNSGGTTPLVLRSFFRIDLSSVPQGGSVREASLYLQNNPQSASAQQNGKHLQITGTNSSVIDRVIEQWDEKTITWNNQPEASEDESRILLASTEDKQDYTIEIQSLLQFWIDHPERNFGVRLKLLNESGIRCLLFASSNHTNVLRHPYIEFCYRMPTTKIDETADEQYSMRTLPNPFSSECIIIFHTQQEALPLSVVILDIFGRKVRTLFEGKSSGTEHRFIWNGRNDEGEFVPVGMYLCSIAQGSYRDNRSIIRQ